MEDALEGKAGKLFTLKNGKQMEAGLAMAAWQTLQNFQLQHPDLFQVLLSIAQERPDGAAPEAVTRIKTTTYFMTGDAVRPDIRDVLLSAYQETSEGAVLVNPIQFANADEAREIEQLEKQGVSRMLRELNMRGEKDPGSSKG
jgi:hypothetical protein